MRPMLALLVVLTADACTKREPSSSSAIDGAASASTPSSGSSTADASTSSGAGAPSVVNLLHHTDALITLSSRVDNPRDYPEHLVDGKPATAWNGKTGDLRAWIEVKLDPRVHVTAIAITAGFDKGDLFEKNLRIKTLRIERDGAPPKDVDLDVDDRRPQRIAVDGPGGTWKLTVVDTKPGKNPAWKEIVVSELQVLGTAPPGVLRSESKLPKMAVAPGNKPPPLPASIGEVTFEGRSGPSLAAICAEWKAEVLAVVKREQLAGNGLEGFDANEVKCARSDAPPFEGTLPHEWSLSSAANLKFFDGVASKDDQYLVLERKDGVTVAGPLYSSANDIGDSPMPGYWRAGMGISRGAPVLLVAYVAAWHSPYESSEADALHVEYAGRVCRIDATRVTCDQPIPTVFRVDRLDGARGAAFKTAPRSIFPPIDPATGTLKPWPDFAP